MKSGIESQMNLNIIWKFEYKDTYTEILISEITFIKSESLGQALGHSNIEN